MPLPGANIFFAASCSIMLGAKRLVAFSSPVQCASLAKRSREAAKRRLGSFIGGLCLFFSFESSPQSALEAFVFAFFYCASGWWDFLETCYLMLFGGRAPASQLLRL